VNPPTWLDERGQPRPSARVRGADERIRHRVEGIPVPDVDGRGRLFALEGEAT
jgi:hypothetical protein